MKRAPLYCNFNLGIWLICMCEYEWDSWLFECSTPRVHHRSLRYVWRRSCSTLIDGFTHANRILKRMRGIQLWFPVYNQGIARNTLDTACRIVDSEIALVISKEVLSLYHRITPDFFFFLGDPPPEAWSVEGGVPPVEWTSDGYCLIRTNGLNGRCRRFSVCLSRSPLCWLVGQKAHHSHV